MSLKARLNHLEKELRPTTASANRLTRKVLFVDDEGRILDDGSAEVAPYAGRHYSEWPDSFVQIIGGGLTHAKILGIR